MTDVELFNFRSREVRTVTIDGEPWFVAADVCGVLGITNTRNVYARLTAQDKGVHTMDTPGGPQQMTIVNESGLYDLILDSRKPEAREFRRWVTSEVLPQIRKTGYYAVPLSNREIAMKIIAEADRADAAEAELKTATIEIEAAQPKVEIYDGWMAESDAIEMTDFAKRIGFTPPSKFIRILRDIGVLRKDRIGGGRGRFRNSPTRKWEDCFEMKITQIQTGEWIDLAHVTPHGQVELLEFLRDEGFDV